MRVDNFGGNAGSPFLAHTVSGYRGLWQRKAWLWKARGLASRCVTEELRYRRVLVFPH